MDYRLFFRAEEKVGGRFKLAALLQKRIVELMHGDDRLVDIESDNLTEIALHEILEGRITLELANGAAEPEE